MVPAEGDYIKHGRIRGLSEKMEWELLDAVTGEVVDSGEIGGQAPGVLVFYTGDPEAGFTEYLTIESVDAQMSSAWERMGRRWIWDSHNPYSTD